MKRSGFALLELIIVVGILSIITGLSVPVYRNYQIRSDLNIATEQVTQGLIRARVLAQSGEEDSAWGFYIPAGVLYKGTSYATRDTTFDEVYPMPSSVTVTGLFDVGYSKLGGVANATGTTTLTALNRDEQYVSIVVEKETVPTIETDSLIICHVPSDNPSNPHTLTLNESAWPSHSAHGDSLGPCPGQAAASSAASSVASSVSSSGGAGGATCTQRFSVASNGRITTTGTVNVTFNVLGSDITYGSGGPEVNVYASYQKSHGAFKNLFGGSDVDGGETQTISGFNNGDTVTVKVRGYYKQQNWLRFDEEYTSADQTGHVVTLRDGDSLPNYPVFGNQANLNSFLRNIIDVNGKIDIGEYDLVMLVELGALNSSSADFQDAVILLSFSTPSC